MLQPPKNCPCGGHGIKSTRTSPMMTRPPSRWLMCSAISPELSTLICTLMGAQRSKRPSLSSTGRRVRVVVCVKLSVAGGKAHVSGPRLRSGFGLRPPCSACSAPAVQCRNTLCALGGWQRAELAEPPHSQNASMNLCAATLRILAPRLAPPTPPQRVSVCGLRPARRGLGGAALGLRSGVPGVQQCHCPDELSSFTSVRLP